MTTDFIRVMRRRDRRQQSLKMIQWAMWFAFGLLLGQMFS